MVKFLGDNPATTNIKDKNLLVLQEGGKDYIASWAVLLDNLKTDLLNPMLDKVKTDLLRPALKTQIGRIIINMDNSKRDVHLWNDGLFEYYLCDGSSITAEGYPELAAIYGAKAPNFQNATVRHIPAGNSRTLGDYQADALQNLTGGAFYGGGNALLGGFTDGTLAETGSGVFSTGISGGTAPALDLKESSSDSSYYNTCYRIFKFDASRVARTASETRMQNIAVQFYVIARVMI